MGLEEFQEAFEFWAGPEGGARQKEGKFGGFIVSVAYGLPRGTAVMEGA